MRQREKERIIERAIGNRQRKSERKKKTIKRKSVRKRERGSERVRKIEEHRENFLP